jgi:hypothetical protein
MKKLFIFFLICFIVAPCVFARDSWGMGERVFEFGINFNASLSNNYITLKEIFQEEVVLDLDKLGEGLRLNFNIAANPLFFNFNSRNNWGFGLATGIQAYGNIDFSGNMLSFNEAINDKSEIGIGVFAEARLPFYFTINKLKIKVNPSVYYPLVYSSSEISYTYFTDSSGTVLSIGYNFDVYTAFSIEDGFDFSNFSYSDITSSPGVDFHLGVEYPVSAKFLDLGLDFYNIPIVPSKMRDHVSVSGYLGTEEPFKLSGDMDMGSIFSYEIGEPSYGQGSIKVRRPFKMYAWFAWRPFGIRLFTLTPTFGFSYNPIYSEPFFLEGGIKANLNIINLIKITAGIGYYDRIWINNLDLALNLRIFEIIVGVDLRAPDFKESWQGGGFGVNVGFRFGW